MHITGTGQNPYQRSESKNSPSAVYLRKQESFIHVRLWKIGQLYVDNIIVGQIIAILRKTGFISWFLTNQFKVQLLCTENLKIDQEFSSQ